MSDLGIETLDPGGLRREPLREELQGDRLAELQIIGAVNLSHPALAEEPDDAVTLDEDRAGGKAAPVE
jgi:hypothetical protein